MIIVLSLFTGIALSSVVLFTGVLHASALTQNTTSTVKSDKQLEPTTTSKTTFVYVAQITTTNSLEQAVSHQINQHRTNLGLPALTLDPRVSDQARIHSQDMANGVLPLSHSGFTQRVQTLSKVIPYSAAAENVAYNQGYDDPATRVVRGWLQTSGHRQNIEAQYDVTGVGVAKNARGEYYFTQIFIRSR